MSHGGESMDVGELQLPMTARECMAHAIAAAPR